MASKKQNAPKTTAQRLDSIIRSARNRMRKDRELETDLTRLPTLTWLMFLKFIDDMERVHEDEAVLAGEPYRPLIEAPYRWRDWAADPAGLSGEDLIAFIGGERTMRPDGTPGPGLFAYLRDLRGDGAARGRRDVIATVFRSLRNHASSGYVLRDVINLLEGIHFDSTDELQTLGRMYETMLREMRDAAGQNGEFYTPRPVVRFMVEVMKPRLGETVLDPACGTGGFLAETFAYLRPQADTVEARERLQRHTLRGIEAKPLPFLLAQMNLLLHGLEAPDITSGNALAVRLSELGERDRIEAILTNPPFGGEEEAGILDGFPPDRRTGETALLFLQLIMRRLKRGGRGRAGVVVPNGILFGDGMAARIKEDLLANFNLHTIVRLPEGVFSPYTDIPTNLIFLDSSGPTGDIWYWEQPVPEGRRKYSKTQPLQYEHFADCLGWWEDRREGGRAWKLDFAAKKAEARAQAEPLWAEADAHERRARTLTEQARRSDDRAGLLERAAAENRAAAERRRAGDALYWPIYNLDLKNPNARETVDHRPPEEIVESAIGKEREVLAILDEIKTLLAEQV